ncbi:MAG: GNAT family N-acetyltransferase [Clostridiales bacterium]|nr:GNAT family N-acetyltransferase [Clostridiales bacterium]
MIIETERLLLRDMTQEDYDSLHAILTDAETMRHYPNPYDDAGVQRWMDWTLNNYRKHGFGLWAVTLKETGEFIGDCGITMQPIHGEWLPEIGYHFNKKHWRQGYASEAAAACIRVAFRQFGFPAVYSYMTSGNEASWRTAMKCGMTFVEEYQDDDETLRVYRIDTESWEKRHSGT